MNGEEIGEMRSDIRNVSKSVEEIKNYLKESAHSRIEFYTDVSTKLAVINTKQDDVVKYQEKCDLDRLDFTKRISRMENYQSNQRKIAAGVAAIVGTLISGGWEFFKK